MANLLQQVSENYFFLDKPTESMKFAEESKTLSEKLNYKKGVANALKRIGTIYGEQGNYPKAISYFLNAIKFYESIKDEHGIFMCQNQLALTYNFSGDKNTALDILLKCRIGIDNGTLYNNLATLYFENKDYNLSLKFWNEALKYYKDKSDKGNVASMLNNIGSIYEVQNKDTAISFYLESLK